MNLSSPTLPPATRANRLAQSLAGGTSLVARHLTPALAEQLSGQRSAGGWTLEQMIASALANPDSKVGVYVGDADSYKVFAPLLDRMIEDFHRVSDGPSGPRFGTPKEVGPPEHAETKPDWLEDLETTPELEQLDILSVRIRVARNLAGHRFPALIDARERLEIESKLRQAFVDLPPELQGTYTPLGALSPDRRRELMDRHLLFADPDPYLIAGGIARHWPDGRGLFRARADTLSAWVNEEDHLRIIAIQPGAKLAATLKDFMHLHGALEEQLPFAQDPRLGYLSSCPSNLGTGMRASVHVRLPELSRDLPGLQSLAAERGVQLRGQHGESGGLRGEVFDVSNARRFGISTSDCLKILVSGLQAIARAEAEKLHS